jgi:hypothetical protein
VFHRYRQAKFAYGSLILSLSQFLLLPQQPVKMMPTSKVVKIDLKIIILLPCFKSVKLTVDFILKIHFDKILNCQNCQKIPKARGMKNTTLLVSIDISGLKNLHKKINFNLCTENEY